MFSGCERFRARIAERTVSKITYADISGQSIGVLILVAHKKIVRSVVNHESEQNRSDKEDE